MPTPVTGVRIEPKTVSGPPKDVATENARRLLGDQRQGVQVLPKNGLFKSISG